MHAHMQSKHFNVFFFCSVNSILINLEFYEQFIYLEL